MRHSYAVYLLAVVVPSATVVGAGVALAGSAWTEVHRASELRLARTALAALEQDVGTVVLELRAAAAPTPLAEVPEALAARAQQGDTASGLVPSGETVEVAVALPPAAGDPPETLRSARGPLPASAAAVGRAAGYRTALYLDGRRGDATEPAPGPPDLDRSTLVSLRANPSGIPLAWGGVQVGMLVPLRGGTTFAVLAADPRPPVRLLPIPLLVVVGLLLLFASLAGWIQLTGEPRRATVLSVALLSLVPALTAWGFLIHGSRLLHDAAERASRRDLARALAVARAREVDGDPERLQLLTGYDAYRIREGRVVAASSPGGEGWVTSVPAPPPSFTATGRVRAGEDEVAYVAIRHPEGGTTVVTAPPGPGAAAAYDTPARLLGMGLAGWFFLLGIVLAGARREVSA